ncbi:MAG: hypothetical protein ACK5WZ_06485, partial [Pseudobdellovibrionaceae bacterium]
PLCQNCTPVQFSPTPGGALDFSSLTVNELIDTEALTNNTVKLVIETGMNTPIDFTAQSPAQAGSQFRILDIAKPNGIFDTLKESSLNFRYSPQFGFRGKDYAVVNTINQTGTYFRYQITLIVGNTLSHIEPALAIRAMGCIQCHAKVESNILTDFGYGNNYFAGQNSGSLTMFSGSIYGDHANSFRTMDMAQDKSVYVQKALLPITAENSATSLAQYLRSEFSNSTNARTRMVQVVEKNSLYIGAPTGADLVTAFQLGGKETLKYFKDNDTSPPLSGLIIRKNFVHNKGTVYCEGDVVLRGPLYFDNLKLSSRTGCRIYVIGSVFIFGPVNYIDKQRETNLQITSTKSISLGLGLVYKDGIPCEPEGNYVPNKIDSYGTSSLVNRYSSFWTVPGYFLRQSTNPKAFGDSVVGEAALIESALGPMYDASCRPETRNVSYEHLLLNAPMIHGRYKGSFTGTVIAEAAIMSLESFYFSFDPVFSQVPVLPFLKPSQFLEVK